MAVIHTWPENYEDLTWNFMKKLSRNYFRADIVADTYRLSSQPKERKDVALKRLLFSQPSLRFHKILTNFWRMAKINDAWFSWWSMFLLRTDCMQWKYYSAQRSSFRLKIVAWSWFEVLAIEEDEHASNQEIADTKLITNCLHALTRHSSSSSISCALHRQILTSG